MHSLKYHADSPYTIALVGLIQHGFSVVISDKVLSRIVSLGRWEGERWGHASQKKFVVIL